MRRWSKALAVASVVVALGATGCKNPYRVGEYVWVEWEDESFYPAYIIELKGRNRYRVHFENYDSRCDETIGLDRIRGRVEGPVTHPPPPESVACTVGMKLKSAGSAVPRSHYKQGDRVRVSWRGSTYSATIVEVVAADRYRVHYDGHETAWDETVQLDRIVGRK